jgi:hypothetical protein
LRNSLFKSLQNIRRYDDEVSEYIISRLNSSQWNGMASSQLLFIFTILVLLSPVLSFHSRLQRFNHRRSSIVTNARVAKTEEGTEDSVVDKDDPKITIPFKGNNPINYFLIHTTPVIDDRRITYLVTQSFIHFALTNILLIIHLFSSIRTL